MDDSRFVGRYLFVLVLEARAFQCIAAFGEEAFYRSEMNEMWHGLKNLPGKRISR